LAHNYMLEKKKNMKKDLQQNKDNKSRDSAQKEDLQKNPDNSMDQDFPGYPDHPSKEEIIRPVTVEQKKVADIHEKDGEKRNYPATDNHEEESDGSANAFEGAESVKEDR